MTTLRSSQVRRAHGAAADLPRISHPQEVERSITDCFAKVVTARPDHLAIESSAHAWTFAQLDRISNSVAGRLLDLDASAAPVALRFAPGAPVIAAMFAAFKAAKPCLVLDPHDPPPRQAETIRTAGCTLLISDDPPGKETPPGPGQVQVISFAEAAAAPVPARLPVVDHRAVACILRTSGSTGSPKGIPQTHRNLIHQALRYRLAAALSDDDRFALLASCAYAASLSPILGALLHGGTLLPFDLRQQGIEALSLWLRERGITVYQSVPTVFRALSRHLNGQPTLDALRLIRLGGESVRARDLQYFKEAPLHQACRLMVAYSSTETGLVLHSLFDRASEVSAGAALPLRNIAAGLSVRIVDEDGSVAQPGSTGMLEVAGDFLSPGSRDGSLTCRDSPHIYNTGDLARRGPDGAIEVIGRADRRVKIGGLRIELDEVEAALLDHEAVRDAAVLVEERAGRPGRLVAFVVPARAGAASTIDWRSELLKKLPPHLVPARVVALRELPELPGGKVDRKALLDLLARQSNESVGRPPRAEFDRKIARIWEHVLEVWPVSLDDDFTDLGGDSLKALSILREVHDAFGVTLPPGALLEAPTVARLAARVARDLYQPFASRTPLVTLRAEGSRPPVVFTHALDGGLFWLRPLAQRIPDAFPILGLQSPATYGDLADARSISRLAAFYARALHGALPDAARCSLVGYCMGGAIVLELARELPALGVGVERIVLIDTPLVRGSPPGRGASADFVRTIRDRLSLAGWRARLHMNQWRGGHGDIQFSHEYRILVQRLHRRALADYVPRTPGIPIVVLKAQEVRLRDGLDARACFIERLDPPPKVIAIPGDHVTCLHPRNLPSLSRTLVDLLQSPPDRSSC